jgi:curli biogenesis system outer membrane secretion channel CsgG
MNCNTAMKTLLLCSFAFLLAGCTFGGKPTPTSGPMEVGHYPAPPVGVVRPRVAVAPFHVTTDQGFVKELDLSDPAAEEMMNLMDATARFNLIEHLRFRQMLREQNLIDVLEPGEWARPAQLPGVNFVVIGRVLNLSATAVDPAAEFGMSRIQKWMGGGEDANHRVNVTVTCSVDVRLVDPATGSPRVDVPQTFRKTANAASFGIDLTNRDLNSLGLSRNDAQNIVRVVLDDELRQMLPQVDSMLQEQSVVRNVIPVTTAPANAAKIAAPSGSGAAASNLRRICPECGADVSIFDEFCPNCGAKLPRVAMPATSQPAKAGGR